MHRCLWRLKEGIISVELELWASRFGCWEPKFGLLQKQYLLLTLEPSVQPLDTLSLVPPAFSSLISFYLKLHNFVTRLYLSLCLPGVATLHQLPMAKASVGGLSFCYLLGCLCFLESSYVGFPAASILFFWRIAQPLQPTSLASLGLHSRCPCPQQELLMTGGDSITAVAQSSSNSCFTTQFLSPFLAQKVFCDYA